MVSYWPENRRVGVECTLCHAKIGSYNKNKLALLAIVLDNRLLLLQSPQALLPISVSTVSPVGRMVENRVILVDLALVALDRVVQGAPALLNQRGRDEVAANGPDAENVASEKTHDGRGDDDSCLLALIHGDLGDMGGYWEGV
jgi:hypothetical protein